jgi:hypothetical protein
MLDSSSSPQPSTQTTAPATVGSNADYDRERQQQGTGFTNINRVLNANSGAGQQLGQSIGGALTNQANVVKSGIQQGQSAFQAGMQQGSSQANSAIQAGQAQEKQAGESDSDYANRLANATTDYSTLGSNLQGAAYSGPTALNNANQIQTQASNATNLGNLTQSGAGQQQLLAGTVAKPGAYTTGDSALDQLLLGQGGQSYLQQGRQATTGLNQQATNAVSDAANQAAAQTAAIQNNKTNTLQALNNYLSGAGDSTSNGITGITQLAKNQATNTQATAQDISTTLAGLANGTISPSSLTPQQQTDLANMGQYGLSGINLYSKNPLTGVAGNLVNGNFSGQINPNIQYNPNDPNAQYSNNNQAALKQAIGAIASSYTTNPGSAYYQGGQQTAASDLATLLGNTSLASSITAQPAYNTNFFNSAAYQPTVTNLNNQQTLDTNYQNAINSDTNPLTYGEEEIQALSGVGPRAGQPGETTGAVGSNPLVGSDVNLTNYVLNQLLGINNGTPTPTGSAIKPTSKPIS